MFFHQDFLQWLFVTDVPLIIVIGNSVMAVKIKYLFILVALLVVLILRLFKKKK